MFFMQRYVRENAFYIESLDRIDNNEPMLWNLSCKISGRFRAAGLSLYFSVTLFSFTIFTVSITNKRLRIKDSKK